MNQKPVDDKDEWGDFLGDWGKHLVKKYGLSTKDAMDLAFEAAELYAHDARNGWCCACDADIAFAISHLKDEPELNAYYQKKYLELAEELVDNSLQALVIIGNNEYLNGGYINIVELREALANMEKE